MIKKAIQRFCIWLLSKVEDKKTNSQKIDILSRYNKVPVKRMVINNHSILISRDIYLFNVDDNRTVKPYMSCCDRSYREFNPNFNVHFINITRKEFYENEVTQKVIDRLLLDHDNIDLLNENYTKIYTNFKYSWLYKYGGIWCNLTTFCVKNFNKLLSNNNFIMCKYTHDHKICVTDCCFGVQKKYSNNIVNRIYPPINQNYNWDYDSMKLAFYNGSLERNMFLNVKHEKLQNYIYSFE